MAALVVELGGDPRWKNSEGITVSSSTVDHPLTPLSLTLSPRLQPAESLNEDYPQIALYLRDITGEAAPLAISHTLEDDPDQSIDMADVSTDSAQPDLDLPTDALMSQVRMIMEASERGELSAEETDNRLRVVVGEAVNGQVAAGRNIAQLVDLAEVGAVKRDGEEEDGGAKRRKEEPAR